MVEVDGRLSALTFPAIDNPDWDHARTRRLALRASCAEWCQSSLTQREADGLYYHRTDFAYEGLLCLVGGENWKTVDKVGFGVLVDRKPYPLVSSVVEATPDWVAYHFRSEAGPFVARYSLLEIPEPDGTVDTVWVGDYGFTEQAPAGEIFIDTKPLFDLRHMYYFSDPDGHALVTLKSRLVTVRNNRWLALGTGSDCVFVSERHGWDLLYPLGTGNRELVDGKVCFQREYFRGTALGRIRQAGPQCRLYIAASYFEEGAIRKIQHASVLAGKLTEEREDSQRQHLARLSGASSQVATRSYVMSEKFGMAAGELRVPESGGWWFRTPWFKNVFAGFLHNHRTLRLLGKSQMIEGTIKLALRYRDPETGNLPNRIPELRSHQDQWSRTGRLPSEYYQGWDSLILMYAWLAEVLPDLDTALLPPLRESFLKVYQTFKQAKPTTRQGPPVLGANGLLMTLPGHSWISGRRRVWAEGIAVGDLPIRVDRSWQVEDILKFRDGHYAWERYQLPTYYLPEVNAQWLRMLQVGLSLCSDDPTIHQELADVLHLACSTFKPLFWNAGIGHPYNLVTQDGRVDPMVTACGLEAAAYLWEADLGVLAAEPVFTKEELQALWQVAKSELLVTRHRDGRPAAFGVLAKGSEQKVFLGDEQYHEAVCWPRQTPFLIKILRAIGEQEVVRELLATNLDHMLDEGVVFYANEMLSLPAGVNPSPQPATCHDPVPVKNPLLWCSLWCDPYLFN